MGQASGDPPIHDVHELRVRAERRGDQPPNSRMTGSSGSSKGGDVSIPVVPWAEEVRGDHDSDSPGSDAPVERGSDRRLGQLHMSGLHDRVREPSGRRVHESLERLVGLGSPGAVIHDDDSQRVELWVVEPAGGGVPGAVSVLGRPVHGGQD